MTKEDIAVGFALLLLLNVILIGAFEFSKV